jgi:hypothetical protein
MYAPYNYLGPRIVILARCGKMNPSTSKFLVMTVKPERKYYITPLFFLWLFLRSGASNAYVIRGACTSRSLSSDNTRQARLLVPLTQCFVVFTYFQAFEKQANSQSCCLFDCALMFMSSIKLSTSNGCDSCLKALYLSSDSKLANPPYFAEFLPSFRRFLGGWAGLGDSAEGSSEFNGPQALTTIFCAA